MMVYYDPYLGRLTTWPWRAVPYYTHFRMQTRVVRRK